MVRTLLGQIELLRHTIAEATSLAIVDFHVDYISVQGGRAHVWNMKKLAVTRAVWQPFKVEDEFAEYECEGCVSMIDAQ